METTSKFQLIYYLEGQSKMVQSLAFGEHVLGRSVECDIRLPDPIISRQHARVDVLPDGCWIMDLGSANSTQLEGKPLLPRKRTPLSVGQTFTIGPYSLKMETVEEGIEVQATIIGEPLEIKPEAAPQPEPVTVAPPPEEDVFRLRIRKAGEAEQVIFLTDGEWVLGRGEECPIRLQDPAASRNHARLKVGGKNIWISDLGSRNGTLRNGVKLTPNQEYPLVPAEPGGQVTFDIGPFNLGLDLTPQSAAVGEQFVGRAALPLQPRPQVPQPPPIMARQVVSEMTKPLNLMGFERVTIGRAQDNLMSINHPMVSRYHAVIERMGTRYRILDLHSHNGVYLNDQRIENMSWLKEGDNIKVGQEQFVFTGTSIDRSTPEGYTIDVRNLHKWVSKDTDLLKDITLYIGANEFVGLVGMSGAGKTTLQDAINGYRPATDGQVLVSAIDLYENYNMFRNDIGYVPQRDIVHMELTPRTSLDYAAQLRMPSDTAKEERAAAIETTLNDLGIGFRADTQNSRLSGGQLKRVSIGVELLTRPKLFFLDEPTSGLDPGTEYDMMKLLRRLADQGRTIMIITHATKNVMLCDKVIILARGGYMSYFGPPENALTYFDGYRTQRERLEKDMEFDDIYRILNDDSKGSPEEWGKRYKEEATRLGARRAVAPAAAHKVLPMQKSQTKQISALRQFIILSMRSLNILAQDKVSLGLMLGLAPLLGVMNFIWGRNLFDPIKGNSPKTMVIWFMSAVIAVMVGSLSSVREIVKEADIYKRERAVGLKILPYALSKVWIGVVLAVYSGIVILICVVVLSNPTMPGIGAYLAAMVTMVLAIAAGYLLGLVISAGVPNQNAALIVLIAAVVPQLLFAGVLYPLESIPLGKPISYLVNTRWSFEAFVRGTNVFDPLIKDPCWALTKDERLALTDDQKDNCQCMGANIFKNCADIPGIQSKDYYDDVAKAALDKPEPIKPVSPTKIPSPTPLASPTSVPSPTPYPTPTPIPMTANLNRYQELSQEQNEEYSDEREDQFDDFRQAMEDQRTDYADAQKEQLDNYAETSSGQFEDFADEMDLYGDEISSWQKDRESAVAAGESILSNTYDDYGRAFKGRVVDRWLILIIQCFVMFGMILWFQKRKDVI